MLRWRDAWVAAVLMLAACGDSADERPPSEGQIDLDAGARETDDEQDAGPPAQVVLPAPEASVLGDAALIDATPAPVDAGLPAVDAAATLVTIDNHEPELGAANACGKDAAPLAANIKVSEIALYQSVKIPLFKGNAWLTARNAPVLQSKKSLVRVSVEPQSGFSAHTLRGVLSIDNGDKETVLTSERNIARASSDELADSTFDFTVDGALLSADTRISVELLETTCVHASASGARVPALGMQALDAESNGKLHVVIVPVNYGGRTPDTGAAQLDTVRDALRAYYPVADVEVTVRAPISWGNPVLASGIGWSDLLTQIGKQRQQDAVAANVYYFGWVLPSATFKDYCRGGCVLGLAPQTAQVSRSNQIGLGVGFIDDNTYVTIVHELGHAHGLPHAPCAPKNQTIDGADTKFPYTGGKIGVWGWDGRTEKLMSPATYADVMSYCEPTWISDYNYQKLATRSKAVNSAAYLYGSDKQARQRWHGVVLYADGRARWSGLVSDEQPGELSDARALDARGDELSQLGVVRLPLSNDAETFLYLPEPDASWSAIDLGDRVLELSEISPAL